MQMKVRVLDLDAGGKTIVVLNSNDALNLGVYSLDRVIIETDTDSLTAVVNTSEKFVPQGVVAVFDEVREELQLTSGQCVEVTARSALKSKQYIRHKLEGLELTPEEIREIITDVVNRNLNDLELTSFITALHLKGLSIRESTALIEAMVETGEVLSFGGMVCDKHSVGGIPGDKTSLLLVPVVASAGLLIPKTSSRAITSPSGTADRAEMLMPVDLDIDEMEKVVTKTNGCLVWGGGLDLAPAVDLLIQIEHPLNVDPLLLSSILSKKKSAGSTHVVIDIPTGSRAKVKTREDAHRLKNQFVHIGHQLHMAVQCGITLGEQPIGCCIGPSLEAREALGSFSKKNSDLQEKMAALTGILFSMVGKTPDLASGVELAKKLLHTKAEEKLREIIEAQGGDPDITPHDLPLGGYSLPVLAETVGTVRWINNSGLAEIAGAAGCPKDKGAGIKLFKKLGDSVKKGDYLLEIIAEKSYKLTQAEKMAHQTPLMGIVDRWEETILLD
jgi:AMP phosphorylase